MIARYKASDSRNQVVALKILPPEFSGSLEISVVTA
jgi:hypothetical protein